MGAPHAAAPGPMDRRQRWRGVASRRQDGRGRRTAASPESGPAPSLTTVHNRPSGLADPLCQGWSGPPIPPPPPASGPGETGGPPPDWGTAPTTGGLEPLW